MRRLAIGLTMLVLTAACNIPRDPEGTLERVSGGTLRVGISESDPWVIIEDEPTGVEVTLVEGFAKTLSADIEWVEGTEAALTAHYHEVMVVVAVPEDDDPPNDITGLEVTVESHSEIAGLVEDKGAEPKRVPEIEKYLRSRRADLPRLLQEFSQ